MTLPPSPDEKLGNAPFSDLIRVLLSQFKRLLADKGVKLTANETLAISKSITNHANHPKLESIQAVVKHLVNESRDLLWTRWGLTFSDSLKADMESIGNWTTTAEFLEIANEKSNAELRISAGSSLLVAMEDLTFASYLLDVLIHDDGVMDVDAVFAKRVLLHVSEIQDSANWFALVQAWLETQ